MMPNRILYPDVNNYSSFPRISKDKRSDTGKATMSSESLDRAKKSNEIPLRLSSKSMTNSRLNQNAPFLSHHQWEEGLFLLFKFFI